MEGNVNTNVDLSKLCVPDPELRFAVILKQFNDPSSIEVISYVFPMFAMSNNSTLLKAGFSLKEEATEWMENYKKDPSICNIQEDLINGAKQLASFMTCINKIKDDRNGLK